MKYVIYTSSFSFYANFLFNLLLLFLLDFTNISDSIKPIKTITLAIKKDIFIPFISAILDDIVDTFCKDTLDIIVINIAEPIEPDTWRSVELIALPDDISSDSKLFIPQVVTVINKNAIPTILKEYVTDK